MKKELRYRDVASWSAGIFAHIDHEFQGWESSQLDVLFYGTYADKYCAPIVTRAVEEHGGDSNSALEELGGIINLMFGEKWDRLAVALDADYNPLFNVDESYESHDDTESTNESSRLDERGVYGFDSSSASDESKSSGNTQTSGTLNSVKKYVRQGRNSGITAQQLIDSEWELRRKNFIQEVMKDVSDVLTLQIY